MKHARIFQAGGNGPVSCEDLGGLSVFCLFFYLEIENGKGAAWLASFTLSKHKMTSL